MKEMLVSIQHSAPCISPFEGITSPFASLFPPFEGGAGGGCSSAFGLLSFRAKRRISFLFRGEIPHCVRNDKGGI